MIGPMRPQEDEMYSRRPQDWRFQGSKINPRRPRGVDQGNGRRNDDDDDGDGDEHVGDDAPLSQSLPLHCVLGRIGAVLRAASVCPTAPLQTLFP